MLAVVLNPEGGAIEFAGDRARHLGGADAGGENPGLARQHGVRVLAHGVVRGAVHSVDGVHLFDVLSLGHLAERNLTRTRLDDFKHSSYFRQA